MVEQTRGSKGRAERSLTRRVGLMIALVVGLYLGTGATFQVIKVTFFKDPSGTTYSCRQGTQRLYQALQETLKTLPKQPKEEFEILRDFRASLKTEWQHDHSIRAKCLKDNDRQALRALRSIELLRYAEERAIRSDALGLTKWRKQAPQLVRALENKSETTN